jgi:hypothetical protein
MRLVTKEYRQAAMRATAVLLLGFLVGMCGGEKATQPGEAPVAGDRHPAGTYTKPGRTYPRLIVWPDGRFDCIVTGFFICPWTGTCCTGDQGQYDFHAVFSGRGATTGDTLSAELQGVYYPVPPDTIAVTGHSFVAAWNGSGWHLECSITAACGDPQTASWLYELRRVP